jgi:hypothetical protein
MPRRLLIIVIAGCVGGVFAAGLFLHGRLGGALLLLTDAVLVTLSIGGWARARPQGRPARVAVMTLIAAIAVVKLVRG